MLMRKILLKGMYLALNTTIMINVALLSAWHWSIEKPIYSDYGGHSRANKYELSLNKAG